LGADNLGLQIQNLQLGVRAASAAYYRFGVRTVHLDCCVEVDAAYYGAPPGWMGRRVDAQ